MTTVSDESSTVIEIETLIHRIVNEPMELEQYDANQLQQFYQQVLAAIPRYLALYSTAYTYTKEMAFFLEPVSYTHLTLPTKRIV